MKKLILGDNPLTTLAGIALAALYVIRDSMDNHLTLVEGAIAVAIAILGRLAGDSLNVKPKN